MPAMKSKSTAKLAWARTASGTKDARYKAPVVCKSDGTADKRFLTPSCNPIMGVPKTKSGKKYQRYKGDVFQMLKSDNSRHLGTTNLRDVK